MNANKVYESIVKLLFNVVRKDELKYHLYKNKDYLTKFVNLVNDLLKLELDDEISYKDQQWAKTFGKAIVIISQAKQRIQKADKDVDAIYQDYAQFISFTSNEYDIKGIDETSINFTQQDVLDDAKFSLEKVAFFDEQINKKEQEAQLAKQQQEDAKNKKESSQNTAAASGAAAGGFNNNQNQQFNQNQGNPFVNMQGNLPIPPTADPRFYPYTKKPKWLPILKKVIGGLVILMAIMMIVQSIFLMANKVSFSADFNDLSAWEIDAARLPGYLRNGNPKSIIEITGSTTILLLQASSWTMIFNIFVYVLLGSLGGYYFLRKPRLIKEKYRLSYFALILIALFLASFITQSYLLTDPNSLLRTVWYNNIASWIGDLTTSQKETFNNDFNQWWTGFSAAKNLGAYQGIMIATLVLSGSIMVMIITIMFCQPKVDVKKVTYANEEYQRAMMAAMQGQHYEMDKALFEDDDLIITKKSKFKLWWEKNFKKKKSKKDKSEEEK